MRVKINILPIVICLIPVLLITFSSLSFGQLSGFRGEMPISIRNTSSTPLSNYQVQVRINTQYLISLGLMLVNGNDIRFGNSCSSGTYQYWVEGFLGTDSTSIWVQVPSVPANDSVKIYMFFGNPTAASQSMLSIFSGPHSSTDSLSTPTNITTITSGAQRGFRFTSNAKLMITHYGKRVPNVTQRYVTLFNYTTQQLVYQFLVDAGTIGVYNYNLINPFWIQSGQQYILTVFTEAGQTYYWGTSSQVGQHLTYGDMRYCNSCTQSTFPTSTLSGLQYGIPDFLYYVRTSTVTPEPNFINYAPADTNTPTAPAGLTGIPGNQQVALKWNKNTQFDISRYRVFKNTTNNPGTATLIDSVNHPDTAYTATGLTNGSTYYFWVQAVDRFCVNRYSAYSTVFSAMPVSVAINETEIPKVFALYNNLPNPFNPITKIKFDIPRISYVRLTIYDITGRIVDIPYDQELQPSKYTYVWNAEKFASGIYYYKIEARENGSSTDTYVNTKKMVLIK